MEPSFWAFCTMYCQTVSLKGHLEVIKGQEKVTKGQKRVRQRLIIGHLRKIIGHLRQIIGCFSGLAAHLKLGSFFIISVSDLKKIHAQSSSFAMLSHMVVNWTFIRTANGNQH